MVGRSKVWRLSHFADPDRTEVQCNICPTKIKFVGNTTNIARHLELKHPEEYAALTQGTLTNPSRTSTNGFKAATTLAETINSIGSSSSTYSGFRSAKQEQKTKEQENLAIRKILQIHNNELQKLKAKQDVQDENSQEQNILEEQRGNINMLWSWHSPVSIKEEVASEDSKMDLSSFGVGESSSVLNESSQESNADGSEDQPLPPSPEQYLMEDVVSPPPPCKPESYKLQHNNHLTIVLESLAADESFMDVTLTAQGKAIKAHKSVLSAVSPYFKGVLKQNPCQHPIIIMPRDIQFEELNSIVSYIYRGEITIATENIGSLLKTAELLQVSGLSSSESSALGGFGNNSERTQQQEFLSRHQQPQPFSSRPTSSTDFLPSLQSLLPKTNKSFTRKSLKRPSSSKGRRDELTSPLASTMTNLAHSISLREVEMQPNSSFSGENQVNPMDLVSTDLSIVKEEIVAEGETWVESDLNTKLKNSSSTSQSSDKNSVSEETNRKKSEEKAPSLVKNPPELATAAAIRELITKSTVSVEGMSSNVSSKSPDVRPYLCPHCLEIKRPLEILKSHLSIRHATKPSFVCSDCAKVFLRQSIYEQHLKTCKEIPES